MEKDKSMSEGQNNFYPQLQLMKFRWEQEEQSIIEFTSGLNILHGKTQAERTVVLRLIHYALGGNAKRIDDEDLEKSSGVKLRFRANGEMIDFSRSCREVNQKIKIQEWDGEGESFVDEYSVDRISTYLIDKLKLPVVYMSRMQQGKAVNVPLSFNDIYRAIFIDRDISYSDVLGGVYDQARKETIRVLMGLTTREIAEAENIKRQLETVKRQLEQRITTIRKFLEDLKVPTFGEIQQLSMEISQRLKEIDNEEFSLRQQVRTAANEARDENDKSNYENLRDEFINLRQELEQNKREILNLTHYQKEKEDLRSELDLEIKRINRHLSSQHVISTFTFSQCPRCQQSIDEHMRHRENYGNCMLCNRAFQTHEHDAKAWEKVLRDTKQTVKEVDELIQHYQKRKESLEHEVNNLEKRTIRLENQLTRETEKYVSPLIEQIQLRAIERTELERKLSQLEYQLQERQHATHLEEVVLPEERQKLEQVEMQLEDLRRALGSEAERYDVFLKHFRYFLDHVDLIRHLYSVNWNEEEQMPYINNQPCKKALTGPDLAVAVLAFHYSLLAMAVEDSNIHTNHPKILIIDEPEQQKMGKKRYQQVMDLFGNLGRKHSDKLQIIIATATEDIPEQFEHFSIEL